MLGIDHLGIVVDNIHSAMEFWQEVFNFKLAWREQPTDVDGAPLGLPGEAVRIEGAILAAPGRPLTGRRPVYLELHQYHRPTGVGERRPCDTGFNHLCLHHPNPAREHARLRSLGVRVFGEPRPQADGPSWFWFEEPNSRVPVGIRNLAHPLTARDAVALAHPGLVVPDLEKALRWYRGMFGWAVVAREPATDIPLDAFGMGEPTRLKGVTMDTGSGHFELIEFLSPHTAGKRRTCDIGQGHVAVFAERIEEEYARLKRAGMHFFGVPTRITHGGLAGTTWVYGTDPYGNIVELTNHPSPLYRRVQG